MLQFFGAFVWTVICCFKPTILNVATYGASKVVILLSSDDSIPRIYSNFSGCAIRIGLKHSLFYLVSLFSFSSVSSLLLSDMNIGFDTCAEPSAFFDGNLSSRSSISLIRSLSLISGFYNG